MEELEPEIKAYFIYVLKRIAVSKGIKHFSYWDASELNRSICLFLFFVYLI